MAELSQDLSLKNKCQDFTELSERLKISLETLSHYYLLRPQLSKYCQNSTGCKLRIIQAWIHPQLSQCPAHDLKEVP